MDALTAMKITGHKTMARLRRYNTIDEPDLSAAQARIDTYLNATATKITINENLKGSIQS